MAGLLDFMNTDQGRLGLGLLGAAAPSMAPMNFAGRLAQGFQNYQGLKADDQRQKLMEAQMQRFQDESAWKRQELELAKAKFDQQQALMASMFGGAPGATPTGATVPAAGAAPVVGADAAVPAEPNILDLARQYGIPEQAIQADLAFNGGKKIAELLAKHGAPDMQVTNGYAYDKNSVRPGYLPSLSTSQDGKTSMVQIGPGGQPVVSAPRGAMETFAGYQGAQASFKPIKVYNPATGREEYTSERAVVAPAAGNGFPSGYAGGSREAADAGRLAILREELSKPDLPPEVRAGLEREIARMQPAAGKPMAPTSGNFAAGPSLTEQADAKADETRKVDAAKADVVRDSSKQDASKLYGQLTAGADRAIELLKQSPTASGAGALADSAASFIGRSTKGADVASQLDTLSGWLTANVPRMQGPQSDKDVMQYRIMAAEVGNRSKPVSQRLAAAQELKALQNKYAELNGGYAAPGGGDKSAGADKSPAPKPMKGMVRGGYKYIGGDPANQASWEKI